MILKRLVQVSVVYTIAAIFSILCIVLIYLYLIDRYGLKDLYLIFFELIAGTVITLSIVENALKIERQRMQSQFASLDRLCILNSLAELVVFAYIRLVKGETGDIYEALGNIRDPRPIELYLYRGSLGYDKILSLITDLENFSANDFVWGDSIIPSQSSSSQNKKILAERFRAYFSDTNTIIRNLPAVIDRAIQTSSTINDKELLSEIREQALLHEKAVINKLNTESDAINRYFEIFDNLSIMVENCAKLENKQHGKRNQIIDNMLAIVLQIAAFLICFVLSSYAIVAILMSP